ncbi:MULTISPECIES: methyl-accepting chemotaxis protein [Halomonadaceae]|uniref:methyl-accepting chemotaxis protein n=1 Tax=Halomonadaceae TaxID=28256 RepID=UPI001597A09E|nr:MULTISPECIES: methyl-accepting chemotaxis protein [Halomonas]QJQ96147.1 methyl-accepting chemotaxis protein [Halomonas sp. PA5]
MTHLFHRISIGRKFMLALALPMLAMLYFALNGILERQQVVNEMTQLQTLTTLAQQAGALVHEVQRERGMTSGFLGSDGRNFRDELNQQRPATERQMASFRTHLEGLELAELDAELVTRIETANRHLDETPSMRRQVDGLAVPTAQAIAHYTRINSELMDLVGRLGHTTRQASVSQPLAAYYTLLEAKDLAGIERALLSNVFGADRIEPAILQRLMVMIGEEAAFLESFATLTTDTMRERLSAALAGQEMKRLAALRELVIQRADQGDFGIDPQQWFDQQTVKIGRLKTLEDEVTAEVLSTASALRQSAQQDLMQYLAIALVAMGLASLLAALTVRSIVLPLKRSLEEISQRGGDLTQRLAVPGSDELSKLYLAFNGSTTDTERLVTSIKQSALSIEVASGEIALGNQDLAQRTEEQSASLVETASSMEQITATVRQNADNARQAHSMSEQVVGEARQASEIADQARQAMSVIHEANRQVSAIVSAIDAIAFQTNLLALNASVEAARAGEHGRGFAVVASEVRGLASRSASEAERIRELISHNVSTIEEGGKLVATTNDTLSSITERVDAMARLVSNISEATIEQSAGIEQINQAMVQLEEVTQQNAALVEQVAAASKSLDEQAVEMTGIVGQFKVSELQELTRQKNSETPARIASMPQPHALGSW